MVLFLAIFGDWIANEKPAYCQYEGKSYFPLFEVPMIVFPAFPPE